MLARQRLNTAICSRLGWCHMTLHFPYNFNIKKTFNLYGGMFAFC